MNSKKMEDLSMQVGSEEKTSYGKNGGCTIKVYQTFKGRRMQWNKRKPVPLYGGPITETIQILVPGMNGDDLCQDGECGGCGADITANRKRIYCPFCGVIVGLI